MVLRAPSLAGRKTRADYLLRHQHWARSLDIWISLAIRFRAQNRLEARNNRWSPLFGTNTRPRQTHSKRVFTTRTGHSYRPNGRRRRADHVNGGSRTRTYANQENDLGPANGRKGLRRHQGQYGSNSPRGLQATLENLFRRGSPSITAPSRIRPQDRTTTGCPQRYQ